MTVRHLTNSPEDLVNEALGGYERAMGGRLRWNRDPSYLIRADERRPGRVAVLSGGGSGHEPLHSGFVGKGMLDVAVPGAVFASPAADQVAAGTLAADLGGGVLQVVKNYTGDVMNFTAGAEMARAEGAQVEQVLVDDDLATSFGASDGPGRRGTTGTVIVEKLCGAASERGMDLTRVAALGHQVVSRTRTFSLALAACTHPGDSRPSFDLPDGMVEVGVGIHGERGTGRRPYGPARDLVRPVVKDLVSALGLTRGERVLAIVNSLGSTHPLELNVVFREMALALDDRGVIIARALVGPYVTALDMRGVSVTLSKADDEMLSLWDDPVRTQALAW